MGTLKRLGQGIRKIFKPEKKVNISEVNKVEENTPEVNHGGGGQGEYAKRHRCVLLKSKSISPLRASYRCGRGFLTQYKSYKV